MMTVQNMLDNEASILGRNVRLVSAAHAFTAESTITTLLYAFTADATRDPGVGVAIYVNGERVHAQKVPST